MRLLEAASCNELRRSGRLQPLTPHNFLLARQAGPPSPGVGLNLTEAGTQSLPPRPPSPGPPSPGAGLNLAETRIQSSPPRPPSPGPPSPGACLDCLEERK